MFNNQSTRCFRIRIVSQTTPAVAVVNVLSMQQSHQDTNANVPLVTWEIIVRYEQGYTVYRNYYVISSSKRCCYLWEG